MPLAAGTMPHANAAATRRDIPAHAIDCASYSTVKSCFEQVLQLDHVAPDDEFFELGGDSVAALELALTLESATGIAVPRTAAFDAPTPAEMTLLIEAQHQRHAGEPVLLTPNAGPGKLFLFPGAGGTALGLRSFARALRTDLAVYGFDAPGLDGRQAPYDRIEDLAAYHLRHLRHAQPHGPYHLAGYSVGGLVAFEVAQRLSQQGEAVAFLGLIDSFVSRRHYGWAALFRIWARRARRHLAVARRMRKIRALRYAAARLRNIVPDILPPTPAVTLRPGSVSDAGAEANRHYAPRRYNGPVALLWSQAGAEHTPLDIVWRTRARNLAVHRLRGDHNSVMTSEIANTSEVFSAALKGEEVFFSEEKNQKTFESVPVHTSGIWPGREGV
jgi:thioesterase domain-containing protein/acyl carrier protein